MKTITVVLIFLLVFTVIKLSGIVAISKLMKPSEKQIEEARQKRLQAEKEGKDPFEDWDERDDDGDRKSTRLNSSHSRASRMPSSA